MYGFAAAKIKVVWTAAAQTLIAATCTERVVYGFGCRPVSLRGPLLGYIHEGQFGFVAITRFYAHCLPPQLGKDAHLAVATLSFHSRDQSSSGDA
jgi:hypothetical protein